MRLFLLTFIYVYKALLELKLNQLKSVYGRYYRDAHPAAEERFSFISKH